MASLAEQLPKEIERVQEIVKIYEEVPGGKLSARLMRNDIERAQKSILDGDTVQMIRLYKELSTWEL